MASRRPTDFPRSPDVPKEIPKVIKADEKASATGPAGKTPAPRAKRGAPKAPTRVAISEDIRRGMIAEGAYLRSEKRGFAPGRLQSLMKWSTACLRLTKDMRGISVAHRRCSMRRGPS